MKNQINLLKLINEIREENGSPPLVLNSKLTQAAELHAAFMLQHNILSHSGREDSTFDERIRAEGYSYRTAAENIAEGASTAKQVLKLWMESPPHRANLLNPDFAEAGIGAAPALEVLQESLDRYWSLSLATPVAEVIENQPSEEEGSLVAEPLPNHPDTIVDPF